VAYGLLWGLELATSLRGASLKEPDQMVTRLSFVGAICALFALAACSSSNGPSLDPNETDCNDVCSAAAQCANANQQQCTDNCTSKSNGDSSYASAVKSCSDCTTTKTSCTDLLACSDNCLSAVTQ
jgi:hypothetical protein